MQHPNLNVILGPPGTGKTTRALEIMELELQAGTDPRKIGFVSFTKKAVLEAKTRAMTKFNLSNESLPWFRTIHSLVFNRMGYRRHEVVSAPQLRELGISLGIDIAGSVYSEDGIGKLAGGDRLIALDNLARVTKRSLRDVFEEDDHGLDWSEVDLFARSYPVFKRNHRLVDYTDMLTEFCLNSLAPPLDVLIVDEAQDLSRLQWEVMDIVGRGCRVVYCAGDDDQCIHEWSGADVETFIKLRGVVNLRDQSHRISPAAHALATSIISTIHNRRPKTFKPRQSAGRVDHIQTAEDVDLAEGTWLLLARNSYMLPELEQICLSQGVPFEAPGTGPRKNRLLRALMTWERLRHGELVSVEQVLTLAPLLDLETASLRALEGEALLSIQDLRQHHGLKTEAIWHEAMVKFPDADRQYFLSVRARGEKLLGKPRVTISTIHGAKGGEADNVMLLSDISWAAYQSFQRNPDPETRVMYVGLTRALQNLILVSPTSSCCYEFH